MKEKMKLENTPIEEIFDSRMVFHMACATASPEKAGVF